MTSFDFQTDQAIAKIADAFAEIGKGLNRIADAIEDSNNIMKEVHFVPLHGKKK